MLSALQAQDVGDQAWEETGWLWLLSAFAWGSWGEVGKVGKKQVLPVGQGEFHTLPGAFQQGLWDPLLGKGPRQCWLAHLQPETDHCPTPCLGFPIGQGRGNSPCSGPKGFLVLPNVTMSSSWYTNCEGALEMGPLKHPAWKALVLAFSYWHVPSMPRQLRGGETAAHRSSGFWNQPPPALCHPRQVTQSL